MERRAKVTLRDIRVNFADRSHMRDNLERVGIEGTDLYSELWTRKIDKPAARLKGQLVRPYSFHLLGEPEEFEASILYN